MLLDHYLRNLTEQTPDTQSAIIKFFKTNKKPSDDQIHALAGELGIDKHAFEEQVYALLGALIEGIGKHHEVPDSQFDPNELKRGIEIELEHTDNLAIAKEISKDHLAECPDYYTRLDQMEKECEKK